MLGKSIKELLSSRNIQYDVMILKGYHFTGNASAVVMIKSNKKRQEINETKNKTTYERKEDVSWFLKNLKLQFCINWSTKWYYSRILENKDKEKSNII